MFDNKTIFLQVGIQEFGQMLQDEVKKHLKKSNTITASLLPPSSSSQGHHHGQGLLRSSTLLPSSSSISPSSSSLLLPGSSSQQSQKFFLSVSEDSADCSSETSLCVPKTVAWWGLSSWSLEELQNYVCSGMISKKTLVFHLESLGQTRTSLISPWHVKMASK